MTITKLIAELERLKAKHGDVPVAILDNEWREPYPVDTVEFVNGNIELTW